MLRFPPNKKTLTRRELRSLVHETLRHLSQKHSQKIVDEVFEEIILALERGENVKLRGFGTFNLRDKKLRIGRNPKTKEEAIITPRRVVTFKAAPRVIAKINGRPYDETADATDE